MSDHDDSNRSFSPLARAKVNKLLVRAREIADANSCTYIDRTMRLSFAPNDDNTRLVLSIKDAAGNEVGRASKWGSRRIMFVGKCDGRMFIKPDHAIRDGTIEGNEKQTMYITPLDGNADSLHAHKQMLAMWTPESWSKAVGTCKSHAALATLKKKDPTAKQIVDHCSSLANRGAVFFPTSTNDTDDPDRCLKFSGKLVQAKKQHVPAQGTEYDTPLVNDYFNDHPDSGLRLIQFMRRDGHDYTGLLGNIQSIGAALFIVTVHPDYFAKNINKVTTPHRLETAVCLDVSISTGGVRFTMPNMQDMLDTPSDNDDDDTTQQLFGGPVDPVDAFVAERKRQRVE